MRILRKRGVSAQSEPNEEREAVPEWHRKWYRKREEKMEDTCGVRVSARAIEERARARMMWRREARKKRLQMSKRGVPESRVAWHYSQFPKSSNSYYRDSRCTPFIFCSLTMSFTICRAVPTLERENAKGSEGQFSCSSFCDAPLLTTNEVVL